MTVLSHEQRLKNFQTALAMAGVSTNMMTCDLIHSIAAMIDAKGSLFSVGDAEMIKDAIHQKYQALQAGPMPSAAEIERMMREGKIMFKQKSAPLDVGANPDATKQEPAPEKPNLSLEEAITNSRAHPMTEAESFNNREDASLKREAEKTEQVREQFNKEGTDEPGPDKKEFIPEGDLELSPEPKPEQSIADLMKKGESQG